MFLRQIRNLALTVLLLALISIGLYLFDYLNRPRAIVPEDLGIKVKSFKNVSKILIQHGKDGQLVFERKGKVWYVNGKPADNEKVRSFLDSLTSMVIESELGKLKGREREFSLDKLSRYRLVLVMPNANVEIYLGKIGPTLHTRYLAVRGRDAVYLVAGSFVDDVALELKDWRDKKLIKLSGLKEMTVETTSTSWSLKMSGKNAIIILRGKKTLIDAALLESLKINLEGVKAEDFIDNPGEKERKALEKPFLRVKLVYAKGEKELVFAKKDSEYYYVSDSTLPWIFIVPFYHVESLLPESVENYIKEQQ
jgi:hypothetical protein